MEELLAKIRETEALALKIKEKELQTRKIVEKERRIHQVQATSDFPEHGDWLEEFRSKLGSLDRPLTVLSLFDGIGGTWAALDRLQIRYKGYSSEINGFAVEVIKSRYPNVTHLGDVRDIRRGDIEETDLDLIVAGFPCQDLTSMGKRLGLHGSRSRLFFDMLRVFNVFRPKWFLVENVASMGWIDREEISKYLNCLPIEIDSQDITASKRKRLYWTNIPLPDKLPDVRNHESNLLQHALDDATALEEKIGCVLTCNFYVGGFGQLQRVFDRKQQVLRYVTVTELEKVMGFLPGHTDIDFGNLDDYLPLSKASKADKAKSIRWSLLGNSFSVAVISYMLSPLMQDLTWENHIDFNFCPKFKENECSVLEEGELWALYNTRSQPSWYALILSRSGDRFNKVQANKKKKALQIRICFLELDNVFLAAEDDKWSPLRGTGMYNRTDTDDTQTSWVTFSHRMTNFKKFGDSYFIYPGDNEVWAVYDRDCSRPTLYYVLVLETEIGWDSIKKPGREGFVAQCKLLQRTSTTEVFRCTETEVVFKDLAQFCFRVPYFFKGEARALKLELSKACKYLTTKHKKKKKRDGRKRRKRSSSDSSDEEDEDEDEEDDEENEDDEERANDEDDEDEGDIEEIALDQFDRSLIIP